MRGERGQALMLFALLSSILIGFIGLVIDGGEVAAQQQRVQAAADGGALAAAYGISQPGATTASAGALAATIPASLGLPAGDLSLTYLDAAGRGTGSPGAVRSVRAVVADLTPTFFLKVLGIQRVTVTASATAAASPGCSLCVLGSGTTVAQGLNSRLTIAGGSAVVDSTANPNLALNDGAQLTATAVVIAGGNYYLGAGSTITPTPIRGAPAADPFAALELPPPAVAGAVSRYVSPLAGSGSISPGVYSQMLIRGTYTLTMTPGVYVLTDSLLLSGTAQVLAAGVTLYLTCDTYPTDCNSGGGGNTTGSITVSGGQMTLGAPSAGSYAGIAVLADPGCSGTNDVNGGVLRVRGAFDTPAMTLQVDTPNQATFSSQVVVDSVVLSDGATLDLGSRLGLTQ